MTYNMELSSINSKDSSRELIFQLINSDVRLKQLFTTNTFFHNSIIVLTRVESDIAVYIDILSKLCDLIDEKDRQIIKLIQTSSR